MHGEGFPRPACWLSASSRGGDTRGGGSAQGREVNGRSCPLAARCPPAATAAGKEGVAAFLGSRHGPAVGGKTEDLGCDTWLGLHETGCRREQMGHSWASKHTPYPRRQGPPWGPLIEWETEASSHGAARRPERPGKVA